MTRILAAALALSFLVPAIAQAGNDVRVTVDVEVINNGGDGGGRADRDAGGERWQLPPPAPLGFRCVTPWGWAFLPAPMPVNAPCATPTPMGPVYGFAAP